MQHLIGCAGAELFMTVAPLAATGLVPAPAALSVVTTVG
jgi:hypothetical protein